MMPIIFSTEKFEKQYTYIGKDLGVTYTKEKTVFRVSFFMVVPPCCRISVGFRRTAVYDEQKNQQGYEHQRRKGVERGLDALAGCGVDQRGEILHQRRSGEVADGEIIQRQGECQHSAGYDTLPDLGDDYVGKRIRGRCAKIQSCLVTVLVHLFQLWHH